MAQRQAQEGSCGRWYIKEGYKVVAGPYEERLAKRLTAAWNRRHPEEARLTPRAGSLSPRAARMAQRVRATREAAPRPSRTVLALSEADLEYVGWLGTLLLEEGSAERAWQAIAEACEHWDGEVPERVAARAKFERLLPVARRQNAALRAANGR